MPLQILYSDADIVVCVKPAGVLSEEPGMPRLLSEELGGDIYCVHRLDRAVGGVMVYARTAAADAALSRQIAACQFHKEYLAVVQGRPEEDSAILRDLLFWDRTKNKSFVVKRQRGGVKDAELEYALLEALPELSLLRVILHTGRTHQIRVQFSSRAMPLVGDVKYGSRYRGCALALWSHSLGFRHPATGKAMSFSAMPELVFPWNGFEYFK